MTRGLEMWVVYRRPKDFPDNYVARLWRGEQATDQVIVSPTLVMLQKLMEERYGLHCLPRFSEDDPSIVEVWL